MAIKEKNWKGDFVPLESLSNQTQSVSQTQSHTGWTFPSLGQDLVAQPTAQPKKEIKGIFQWTNAFHVYMSIFIEGHPALASELLKYTATIREFSQTLGNTAWLKYDLEFRKKQARRPTNSWSSIDMELYAKMLMFGNTIVNQCYSTGSVFQDSRRQAMNFRPQNRPCFGALTLTSASSATKLVIPARDVSKGQVKGSNSKQNQPPATDVDRKVTLPRSVTSQKPSTQASPPT